MIDHTTLHVSEYQRAREFYAAALKPLGYSVAKEFVEWQVTGFTDGNGPDFWIHGGEVGKPGHVAFTAGSKEEVQAFYDAALVAGGTDNGAPGYREEYGPGYYAAFVHDPDGNNIEAVVHE